MRIMLLTPAFFSFVITCFVIGIIISVTRKKARQERINRNSPLVSVEATVVARRTKVHGDYTRTEYYATFEFIDGKRLELSIPEDRYGYIAEGDFGTLTHQGSRFVSFVGMKNF